MAGVSSKPVNNDEAMNKLKIFSEHLYNHFINLIVTYGAYVYNKLPGLEKDESTHIENTFIKCPSHALKNVSIRLNDLAKNFGIERDNKCKSVNDLANCIKSVNCENPTAKMLIDASRQIFLSYERFLLTVNDADLKSYGKEAAERILKYYVKHDEEFTEEMIPRAITDRVSDETSILQCCFRDLFDVFFKFSVDTSKNKWASSFSKSGIHHEKKIFVKDGLKVNKYKYRRLFEAETRKGIEVALKGCYLDEHLTEKYEFVLCPEHKEQQMSDLMQHFTSRSVDASQLKTELEALQKKIQDDAKGLQEKYKLTFLKKLEQNLRAIEKGTSDPKSPASCEPAAAGSSGNSFSGGLIRNNITSNEVGTFTSNIRGGPCAIDNTLHGNTIGEAKHNINYP